MENKQQMSSDFTKQQNISKKNDFQYNIEEHSLTLRKKLGNRAKRSHILPPSLNNDLAYEINLAEIEPKVKEDKLYIQFKKSTDEKNSLGLLFQMLLIDNNDNILKYSLANIRKFLVNIGENNFFSKNLYIEFNDKLIKYLFDLLQKRSNDFYLLSNICFILNKLSSLLCHDNIDNKYFYNILYNNFNVILNIAKGINTNEPQVKNLLYLLTIKIFMGPDEFITKLEKDYPSFIKQIHEEILKLEDDKFVKNMILISSLLQIINNCFFYKIYCHYFFTPFNKNNIINANGNMENNNNEINIDNIMQFIQKLLNISYYMELFEQELRCIQNFMLLFLEKHNYFKNKNLKKKVQQIIINLKLEKRVLPLLYDNSINEPSLRIIALQILVNSTFICSKKFCENLINNNISDQIIKLENYLLAQTQITNRIKNLYKLLMNLIYNLIENESVYIIDDLSIDNSCISLLFKLQKIPFYSSENKNFMIKIFSVLIQSNHKYIQTLLISEGICEWYKSILEEEPSIENIKMIITNFITMVEYSGNLVKDNINNNNLLLIHLEKIGILEAVDNLKGRKDLNEEVMSIINEFCALFK